MRTRVPRESVCVSDCCDLGDLRRFEVADADDTKPVTDAMERRSLLGLLFCLRPAASEMRWSRVSVSVNRRPILDSASVSARSGRLLGILGPSGAGKTTLLSVLAGRCEQRLNVSGVRSSDVPRPSDVAVLEQSDAAFGLLTVRETLELAADLEDLDDASSEVTALLTTLGLTAVEHARVGDASHRGISGGERRRLAVGCALLARPRLLIADEPTTGLDAQQAARTVRLLKATCAARGIPAVATLHQPRSSIWRDLDDVCLIAPRGRVVYHGPRDGALAHFARLGCPCPKLTNPAEHLIDLVSIGHDDPDAAAADAARVERLARAWADSSVAPPTARRPRAPSRPAPGPPPRPRRPGRARRLLLLVRRSWRQNVRDGWINGLRLAVSGGLVRGRGARAHAHKRTHARARTPARTPARPSSR